MILRCVSGCWCNDVIGFGNILDLVAMTGWLRAAALFEIKTYVVFIRRSGTLGMISL